MLRRSLYLTATMMLLTRCALGQGQPYQSTYFSQPAMTVSPPVSALGGHAGLGSAPAFDGRVFTSVPPSLQTGVNNSGGLISEPPQQNIAYGYSVAPESQQLYQYSSSCQQCAPVCESVVCSSVHAVPDRAMKCVEVLHSVWAA